MHSRFLPRAILADFCAHERKTLLFQREQLHAHRHSLPRFHLDHRLRIDFPFIRKERAETGIIRQFNRFKVIMTGRKRVGNRKTVRIHRIWPVAFARCIGNKAHSAAGYRAPAFRLNRNASFGT